MEQQNKNLFFLLFSVLTVFFLILAGITIAERSVLGFIVSLLGAFGTVGLGFMFKRKWRKERE